jgi:preprotein translocase subunit Sec63
MLDTNNIRKFALLALGWSIVLYMGYRIATTKVENKIWDPFAVLGIPSSASLETVKSHYKKLSRALHPDKVKLIGNMTKEEVEAKFVDITKAYKALSLRFLANEVLLMRRFDGIMKSMAILTGNRNLVLG